MTGKSELIVHSEQKQNFITKKAKGCVNERYETECDLGGWRFEKYLFTYLVLQTLRYNRRLKDYKISKHCTVVYKLQNETGFYSPGKLLQWPSFYPLF